MCDQLAGMGAALAIFPPDDPQDRTWASIWNLFDRSIPQSTADHPQVATPPSARQLAAVDALADAFVARTDPPAMKAALARLQAATTTQASARGEGAKIASEVSFYKADLFFYAQWLYVLGFIGVAAAWLARPDAKIHRILPFALMIPLAFHAAGIAWRCYLRARPPVSTLYETVLFISCVAVLASIVIELIDRRRVAVAFAALIGASGLFLAASYEAKDAFDHGSDTMPQLQAVLDTNYWLSTHVTTVTIGYSAGLLAGFLAHVYVLGKLFGLRKGDANFYRSVGRMTYGVICFGLLFSVVGTILGGVWANDSWGRFWGWDPKENGALMIVLWELAILHARMGGYVRDLGICTAAIFGATIVGFSWWHVNLLGVGLHSYGFTHGLLGKLWIFYLIEWLIVLGGLWLWLGERAQRRDLALAAPGKGALKGPIVEPMGGAGAAARAPSK
jgi:ABC-type transport system involved in cytochrome c biogenesis permease subunit